MKYEETYKGHRIRIDTTRAADGSWYATANLPDHPDISFEPKACDSEREAHRAALSATMAKVDLSRSRRGKP
jgi:hypothetical protein